MKISRCHRSGAVKATGFTLIEIMVVVVILGLLAALVAPNVLGSAEEARVETARMEVKQIYDAVQMFMLKNRQRIPSWEELITPSEKGDRYLETSEPKQDPWGNTYVIGTDPQYSTKPMVVSFGPDKLEGTEDDISNQSLTQNRMPR